MGAASGARYLAGALHFDGAGHVSANNVYSGAAAASATATGTYAANADCTLTLTLNVGGAAAQTYTLALNSTGEATGLETDASAVATIDLQAQFSAPSVGLNFTNASMNGTYAAACSGPLAESSDVNLVTFAGGTLSGTDPYNNGGGFSVANVPYSGTYNVNTDGTFSGALVVLGTNFDFFGVISNFGTEVQYIYSNVNGGAPSGAFASCTGSLAQTSSGTSIQVSLSSVYNVHGITNNGSGAASGGLDTSGYAYSFNLLGSSVAWNGETFDLGTSGAPDAVSSTTISLPAGQFSALTFLGTAVYGAQQNQPFSVTYTDGSTTSFTQSVSDWGGPQQTFAGESVAASMPYRVMPSGSIQSGPWYLYGYSFPLNSAKTVKSFSLPSKRNVVVLAVDLLAPAPLQSQTITFPAVGTQKVGATVALTATASSGLPVSYASSTATICTVAGTTATTLAPGTCTIVASQAGNSTYAAAPSVSQSFTVSTAPPGFTLTPQSTSVTVFTPTCILGICFGGSSGSDLITLNAVNGFAGTASFSVFGLPAYVTGTFSPTTVTASGATTLKLTPTKSHLGIVTVPLTIKATSTVGGTTLSASTTISLVIN